MTNLLLVESPGKTANIKKYLNSSSELKAFGKFDVIACFGHIRDLQKKDLGIEIDNDFKPIYENIPTPRAKAIFQKLKDATSTAKMVYLATDKDLQGEAISYHLMDALKLKDKYQRITFTEINQKALENAMKHPRKIDMNMFHAQEAQRILDRLVGFTLSPILWKNFTTGNKSVLSAGRVQSAALHIIIQREEEIKKFSSTSYWNISGDFDLNMSGTRSQLEGVKLYYKDKVAEFASLDEVHNWFKKITNKFAISDVKNKEVKQNADLPFNTSTLQQEAYSKLGFTLKATMAFAQELYEAGHITYMRTDSYNISDEFKEIAAKYIIDKFGQEYYEEGGSKKKSKAQAKAQNAHECVRCTDPYNIAPDKLKSKDALKLYDLIWKRTIAYLMKPCVYDELILILEQDDNYKFMTTLKQIKFPGYQIVYTDTISAKYNFADYISNIKNKKYILTCESLYSKNIWSSPPQRFTESTLIKTLVDDGIGKPSTYATILSTLFDRQYILKSNVEGVNKNVIHVKFNPKTRKITDEKTVAQFGAEQSKLVPTDIGIEIDKFLSVNFTDIVDVEFTSKMEKDIDEIAEGKMTKTQVLTKFWKKFNEDVVKTRDVAKIKTKTKTKLKTEEKEIDVKGVKYVVRIAKYGPVLQFSDTYIPLKGYLKLVKKGYSDIGDSDVEFLTSLPKEVGKVDNKPVDLTLGPFGLYLKYDGRNVTVTRKFSSKIIRGEDVDMKEVKSMIDYKSK